MSKKILVALRDLGKTNPFNFGTITTAYFLSSAPSFDYTQQGNFEVIAKGICHEEVTELRNLVPIGFYMMAALGKAYQEGKVNAGLFGQAYSDFKLSVETGILKNTKFVAFDLSLPLPSAALIFIGLISTCDTSLDFIDLEKLDHVDTRLLRALNKHDLVFY